MRIPRKADYPKQVLVGIAEVPYRIVYVKSKKWLGKCSYEKRTIWLNQEQTDRKLFMTFVHELLHAIEFESGKRVKHSIIYRFEEGLYLFLLNNIKDFVFNINA